MRARKFSWVLCLVLMSPLAFGINCLPSLREGNFQIGAELPLNGSLDWDDFKAQVEFELARLKQTNSPLDSEPDTKKDIFKRLGFFHLSEDGSLAAPKGEAEALITRVQKELGATVGAYYAAWNSPESSESVSGPPSITYQLWGASSVALRSFSSSHSEFLNGRREPFFQGRVLHRNGR